MLDINDLPADKLREEDLIGGSMSRREKMSLIESIANELSDPDGPCPEAACVLYGLLAVMEIGEEITYMIHCATITQQLQETQRWKERQRVTNVTNTNI